MGKIGIYIYTQALSTIIFAGVVVLIYSFISVVGYETPQDSVGYNWGEDDWMSSWVDYYGSYETEFTTAGVKYKYKRLPGYSTITVIGR